MTDQEIIERLKQVECDTLYLLLGLACGMASRNPALSFYDLWRAVFTPHDHFEHCATGKILFCDGCFKSMQRTDTKPEVVRLVERKHWLCPYFNPVCGKVIR